MCDSGASFQTPARSPRGSDTITRASSEISCNSSMSGYMCLTVRASVQLAGLAPDDVTVEAVIGRVGETDDLADSVTVAMEHVGAADGMGERFESVVKLPHAGLTGYTVRVLPHHRLLAGDNELGLVTLA